ncbi:MAG TPA: hypothetical protein VHV83_06205, partial [Armatimonadota bacterium]|nr:hypothetical protein [Armatimonadota bacterium]
MRAVLFSLVVLYVTNVFAQKLDVQPQPLTAKSSVFSQVQPPVIAPIADVKELPQSWFSAPVTHGEGMFNPIFLPFTYKTEGVPGDPNQPWTFPALLHHKFAFAPDNYSSHSPSSIFRKDPKAWKLKLENKTGIATYAKDWSGTHVIGGELIESAAGYRGSLVVLDADGKTVLQKSYPTPMPYFSLMGNMVEDWMDFRQQPYTAAIRAELERPMTTNMQTVRWYGDMFHVVPFSAEDFAIYERILAADPNFAEVRFWYANRKYWAEGWTPQVNTDYARALLSHPVMMAFDAVSPAEIPDENLAEKYVAELARLTLVFPEHVDVIAHTLIQYDFFEKPQYEAEKYLSLAKKYPCSWSIQDGLARYFFAKNQANMYIPLELSAVQSGYVPADDEFRNNYYTAGIGYWT